jgi:SH3-like domain-containing protein
MLKKFTICIVALIIFPLHSFAKEDLPVPRWVSLNAEANMRKGPSTNASIMYRYQLAGYPMEIIRQIDGWRYVRDPLTNTEGWMSHILFNGARFVITSNKDVNYGYKSDKQK